MIELTSEQVKQIEAMLNDRTYVLNYYKECLLKEDFECTHGGKKPDIIDALRCVFVADGRYREDQRQTYFKIEDDHEWGLDYSIYGRNCDNMSTEEFEEIKAVTLNVLKNLEECYVTKEEEVKD